MDMEKAFYILAGLFVVGIIISSMVIFNRETEQPAPEPEPAVPTPWEGKDYKG